MKPNHEFNFDHFQFLDRENNKQKRKVSEMLHNKQSRQNLEFENRLEQRESNLQRNLEILEIASHISFLT